MAWIQTSFPASGEKGRLHWLSLFWQTPSSPLLLNVPRSSISGTQWTSAEAGKPGMLLIRGKIAFGFSLMGYVQPAFLLPSHLVVSWLQPLPHMTFVCVGVTIVGLWVVRGDTLFSFHYSSVCLTSDSTLTVPTRRENPKCVQWDLFLSRDLSDLVFNPWLSCVL